VNEPGRAIRWGLLGLLLLTAAAWRIDGLAARRLWVDERWTERFVRESESLGEILAVGTQDDHQHPPLGYATAWLAARHDAGPARLRAPSVVAGVASIAGLALVGARLFGWRAGFAAAFGMAISVYHVAYSQEARPYMQGVAWTVGLYAALAAWLARPERRARLALVALCGAAALYTYHLAVLHVGVAAGVLALRAASDWRRGERGTAGAVAAALAAIALVYLPQLPNLIGFFRGRGLEPNHVLALGPRFLHALFDRWASGDGAVVALYELAFAAGALRLARRRDLAALAVLGWAIAPFAVFAALPFAKYFDARFLISSLPVFFLLAGAGVDGVGRAIERAAAGAGANARTAARAGTLACAALAVFVAVPAETLRQRLRASRAPCGNFVHLPEILEADERLCADQFVLNSIATEQQWILRSLHERVRVPESRLAEYVGTYRFATGPVLRIEAAYGTLVAQTEGQQAHQLVAETDDVWWYRVLPARAIRFERDAQGRVSALTLQRRGVVASATRER
jgi:4-amino-4-deoxy-L-arabinose transferase-like glycosyltransferase